MINREENNKQMDGYMPDYDSIYKELEVAKSPDVNEIYAGYKNSGKPVLSFLKETYTPPKPMLTPEQERRARISSSITDSLVTLAEMFANGIGADVRNRNFPSSSQLLNARIDADNKRLIREKEIYDKIMAEGALKDFGMYMDNAMNEYKRQQEILSGKAKLKIKDAQDKLADQRQKELLDYRDQKNRDLALWKYQNVDSPMMDKKYKQDTSKLGYSHKLQMQRIAAQNAHRGRGSTSRSGRGGNGHVMQTPDGRMAITVGSDRKYDKNSYKGALNDDLRDYVLEPREYSALYYKALDLYKNSDDFKQQFKYLRDYDSTDSNNKYKASSMDDWVWAYVQYMHNKNMIENTPAGKEAIDYMNLWRTDSNNGRYNMLEDIAYGGGNEETIESEWDFPSLKD